VKPLSIYLLIVVLFAAALGLVLAAGSRLAPRSAPGDGATPHAAAGDERQGFRTDAPPADAWPRFTRDIAQTFAQPLPILILQMLVVLLAARLLGALAARCGQPAVMGEIVAGILLGPSLLGLVFPAAAGAIFPEASIPRLHLLSQIGLILFMFIVGMEIDVGVVRAKAGAAIAISHASILFPYLLGVLLSLWLYGRLAPPGVSFAAFGLFMGIAMSITAFPVLARIIQERGLGGSPLGSLALACAAADDVTAWCILAAVVALVKGGTAISTLFIIGALLLHVGLMVGAVRPLMFRLAGGGSGEELDRTRVAAIFSVLLFSAFVTEVIGIHALFGAFLAGAIMPRGNGLRERVVGKIQDLSLVVLLPLFFAITGLRTRVALLGSAELWLAAAAVILVAIGGKVGGTAVAARLAGQSWRDGCALGLLMNTRGLMELVVLNIGYDMGILSPEIFSMMVLMALVTTLMAGPCLEWLGASGRR
jgi:Kef-type K+ transport system membrane component KefB